MNLFFKMFTKKSTDYLITSIKYLIVTPRLVFEWIPDGCSLAKLIHKTDHHSYCGRSLFHYEKVKTLVAQSCLTLCDPTDCSLLVFSVHGIAQARIVGNHSLFHAAVHGVLQSMGSQSRTWALNWFPFPVDLPDPGFKPRSPSLQADSLVSEPPGKPMEGYGMAYLNFRMLKCIKSTF